MNDITALAQRMKAAAEKAKYAGEAPVMPFDTRITALYEFQLAACPANVMALVEAIEATEKTSAARKEGIERTHKMFQRERDRADTAEQRIAKLESRTVTVKLPELCVGVVQGGHAVMVPYAAGHWFNKTAILEMLAAAGIQVIEGEGQ